MSEIQNLNYTWNGETKYESDGILNDTIISLIRQGADITYERTYERFVGAFNLELLSRVVFHNSRYYELPNDVKNRILGKSLLYYVEKRVRGSEAVDLFGIFHSYTRNYAIIRCLLKKFHAPTNYLDSEGRTVLEIVENRNNLWENGTYDLVNDPEFSSLRDFPPEVLEPVKASVKKHDQKVYKLFHNNCCSIMQFNNLKLISCKIC